MIDPTGWPFKFTGTLRTRSLLNLAIVLAVGGTTRIQRPGCPLCVAVGA